MTDEAYMKRALCLSLRGIGRVNPNPLVGAVIVRDGRVIGEGWHTCFGKLHAEREALANCAARGEDPAGATVYVTLEPCCHTGKTPPCTEALIEAHVARVVVGASDPNPLVAGKGCEQLRAAGIAVDENVLADECRAANEAFFHFIANKTPFVIAKYAMTLDGKIATRTGLSRWITGQAARRRVHLDRARYAAVMVGAGTAIADDPELTCRIGDVSAHELESAFGLSTAEDGFCTTIKPRNPLRVICDTRLRLPVSSRLVQTARETPTLIMTCNNDKAAHAPYLEAGVEVVAVGADAANRVDIAAVLHELGSRGIDSVIAEGGAQLLASLFDARLVNKVQAYIAPKVFGGQDAPGPVAGTGAASVSDALVLEDARVTTLGADILIEGRTA